MSNERRLGSGLLVKSQLAENVVNQDVGYTPESLVNRVQSTLSQVGLTAIEGHVLGYDFSLSLIDGGFLLKSITKSEPWEEPIDKAPEVYAQANQPDDVLSDGQIIWMDKSSLWRQRNEITNGQKISYVLDKLIGPLEQLEANR